MIKLKGNKIFLISTISGLLLCMSGICNKPTMAMENSNNNNKESFINIIEKNIIEKKQNKKNKKSSKKYSKKSFDNENIFENEQNEKNSFLGRKIKPEPCQENELEKEEKTNKKNVYNDEMTKIPEVYDNNNKNKNTEFINEADSMLKSFYNFEQVEQNYNHNNAICTDFKSNDIDKCNHACKHSIEDNVKDSVKDSVKDLPNLYSKFDNITDRLMNSINNINSINNQ